jgi:translation elongation factor EF-Ts
MISTYINNMNRSGRVIALAKNMSYIYRADAMQVAMPIIAKSNFSLAMVVQCNLLSS